MCGEVEFACDIKTNPLKIYQCHCTLCKKQTGSSSNSATIIPIEKFEWIKEGTIKRWRKETGFNAHFCETCGSPVPNTFANKFTWIPAGLLNLNDKMYTIEVVAHFCLSTKSSWHIIDSDAQQFDALPEFKTLLNVLEYVGRVPIWIMRLKMR
ncbi:GFA family protein [Psychrobacter sp.]|uniref:GFA family protein n=1 Tax=Psychrobacter sp. TaxID=56811 RepID=UPI0025F8B4CF|nr:GFA family protein [Psychrobacter sp.]